MEDYCMDDPAKIFEALMCLNALSKNARGEFSPADAGLQICEEPSCKTLKTVQVFKVEVFGNPRCDSALGALFDGVFLVEQFISAYEDGDGNNRGMHSGDFRWESSSVVAEGRISGVTNAGTHRPPVFDRCQPCDARGYMEGRFCGRVVDTRHAELEGCYLLDTYCFRFDPTRGGIDGATEGTFEGELICPCH